MLVLGEVKTKIIEHRFLYTSMFNIIIAEVRCEYPWVFFALGVFLIWLPIVYFVLYILVLANPPFIEKSVPSCSIIIGSGRLSTVYI